MADKLTISFRTLPDGMAQTVSGRDAWALQRLLDHPEGVTPIHVPGPRWSGYVFNLRALGVLIETVHEKHGGDFPGTHARYLLRNEIEILEVRSGEAA